MEHIIAKHCYNSNRNGGWFRYPVKYSENGSKWISRGISNPSTDMGINSMKYSFGSNELYIGRALLEIIDLLEDYSDKVYGESYPFNMIEEYLDGEFDNDEDDW